MTYSKQYATNLQQENDRAVCVFRFALRSAHGFGVRRKEALFFAHALSRSNKKAMRALRGIANIMC
jgi:hypothetical protein